MQAWRCVPNDRLRNNKNKKGCVRVKTNNLKEIKGKRIRRQYFTIPVVMHYVLMLFIPYCMLVIYVQFGTFDIRQWIADFWICLWICFCFSVPWIILKILNCLCFGKIICVLDEDGIHHRNGFIAWDCISKVEYVIDLPPKYRYDPNQKCRAVIDTQDGSVILLQAPLYILRCIRKSHPQIKTSLSKESKWLIVFLTLLFIVLIPLLPLFA